MTKAQIIKAIRRQYGAITKDIDPLRRRELTDSASEIKELSDLTSSLKQFVDKLGEALDQPELQSTLIILNELLSSALTSLYGPNFLDNITSKDELFTLQLFHILLEKIQGLEDNSSPKLAGPDPETELPQESTLSAPETVTQLESHTPDLETELPQESTLSAPETVTQLESHPPDPETEPPLTSIPPGASAYTAAARKWPQIPGATLFVQIKTLTNTGNDQNLYSTIKMLIDKAEPLMGEVGHDFSYTFDLNFDKYFSVVYAWGSAELRADLGLEVSLEDHLIVIKGQPTSGYDGNLNLVFNRLGSNPDTGELHHKPLYIAADPRSLWQNLPVEDDDGYPVANEAQLAESLPDFGKFVVGASGRGRSHAHVGKPRDDYFSYVNDEQSGWHFVAVADGAGSAPYSRKGAEIACEVVLSQLREMLGDPRLGQAIEAKLAVMKEWKDNFDSSGGAPDSRSEKNFRQKMVLTEAGIDLDSLVYRAVYTAYMAIDQEARHKKARVQDYHTTLLWAAFKKFSFGYFVISYWVGDGALVLYNWNGSDRVLVLGQPDGGEFAGQTRFLTMGKEEVNPKTIYGRTRFSFADDFEALILVTDGLTDPFFPSEKSVLSEKDWHHFWNHTLKTGSDGNPGCPELFDKNVSLPEKASALGHWLDFWSKGNHDDRTILIVGKL